MNDLKRIANALEHLALPALTHDLKQCSICRAKKKPIKKMPPSKVPTAGDLMKRIQDIQRAKMFAGPEQPVGDMFRYRELNKS